MERFRRFLDRVPNVVLDSLLVAVVAVTISAAISVAPEPESWEPDAFAYGIGILIACLLFFRRRWPVGVLYGSTLLLYIYYWSDYPGFVPAGPLAPALYFAVAAGRLLGPLIIISLWTVVPLIYRLLADPEPVLSILNDTLRDGGFFAVVVLLGVAVRNRRRYSEEVSQRLRDAENERIRIARELEVARLVQEQFLPRELPEIPGWEIAAFYRSAREVGGDFYDFTALPGGRIGIVIGDVTDKGAPAALLMATTQGLLRADAPRLQLPNDILARVNDILVPNTPDKMFVTCLYMVLDPRTGAVQLANAGHNLPYLATSSGVVEVRATGFPLGLLPGVTYDLYNQEIPQGTRLLLHSDGVAEAHNEDGEMFGFSRLIKVIENTPSHVGLIEATMAELERFTGPGWEQEDDITLVVVERRP